MKYGHRNARNWRTVLLIVGILGFFTGQVMAIGGVEAISPGTVTESAQISDLSPTFSWSESQGATGYTLAVFETALGENYPYEEQVDLSEPVIFIRFSNPTLSWTPASESGLLYDVPYVWYVRPTADEEIGQWSDGKHFSINSGHVDQAVSDAITARLSDENTVKQIAHALNALSVTYATSPVLPAIHASRTQSAAKEVNASSVVLDGDTAAPRGGSSSFHFRVQSPSYLTMSLLSLDYETVLELRNISATGRNWWIVSGGTGGSFPDGKFGIYDRTAFTPRLTIDKVGNVGIGTTNPTEKLEVSGNISATGTVIAKGSGGLNLDCKNASGTVDLPIHKTATVQIHSGAGTNTAADRYCGEGYSVFQSRCAVVGLPVADVYLLMTGIFDGVAYCSAANQSSSDQRIAITGRCCKGSW